MNANTNGQPNPQPASLPASEQVKIDATALGLEQLAGGEANRVGQMLRQNPELQRETNEMVRLSGLIEHVNRADLPAAIVGLQQQLQEVLPAAPNHHKVKTDKSVQRFTFNRPLLATAASILLAVGSLYWLLQLNPGHPLTRRVSYLVYGYPEGQDMSSNLSLDHQVDDAMLSAGLETTAPDGLVMLVEPDVISSAEGNLQQVPLGQAPQIIAGGNVYYIEDLERSEPVPPALLDQPLDRSVHPRSDRLGESSEKPSDGSISGDGLYRTWGPARERSGRRSSAVELRYQPGVPVTFYYRDYRDLDPDGRSREQYELPPENPFHRPIDERARSTFSIDVDTASYANARRFIRDGRLPPANAVRVEEFINYFSYDYAPPTDGRPFSVHMEVAACPWNKSHQLLRVGLKGKEVPRDDRPASNLVFLIDVSGSMSDRNKLPLLQRSMLMLVDQLTENDRVTIVTYAGDAGLRLPPTSGDQKEKIRDVIRKLSSGGSTHGSAGIRMAYNLATENFLAEGTNRVILATDGDLNVGVTADDDLVGLITSQAKTGVLLSVLGFGTGNLKDAKLEKLADNGNGQYSYIDSIAEARKVLVEEISGSLVTIASDVKIQVEFNPAEVAAYRLIGYENRLLRNQDFDNDQVDAGEIGAGHTVTALYELVPVGAVDDVAAPNEPLPALKYQQAGSPAGDPATAARSEAGLELTAAAETGELVTLALRYKEPGTAQSTRFEYVVETNQRAFHEASSDFQFAASVASLGMLLRHSRHAGQWRLSDVENAAAAALGTDVQGHRAEFVDLVRQTRALVEGR